MERAPDRTRRRRPPRHPRAARDAQRVRRRADRRARGGVRRRRHGRAVVLSGDGPSFCAGADVEWMRASVDLDLDANVADANALRRMLEAIDALSRAGRRRRPRPRARRRRRARRVLGHRDRRPGRRLRVLGGEARDRAGGHLAVRARARSARAQPGATSSRASASTPRPRSASGSSTRSPTTATPRSARPRRAATAGPRAARHAKRLVLDRPDGPETARLIAERRTSEEGQEGLRAFLERRPPAWAQGARRGAGLDDDERRALETGPGSTRRSRSPCAPAPCA